MMFDINTVNTKAEQLRHGSFKFGNGPETMLIVGSCRTIPYLNYLKYLNAGSRFTIHFIDPFYFNYDVNDNRVDIAEAVGKLETDSRILNLLASTKTYIHEFYRSFGMFNSDDLQDKNIYQFGLKPEVDVSIPNVHGIFILFQDFVNFHQDIQTFMKEDILTIGKLSDGVKNMTMNAGMKHIHKFYEICEQTSFPDMAKIFAEKWKDVRFFWNTNHVTNHFTVRLFKMLNERYLKLDTPESFWERVSKEDMFVNPHTPITKYDQEVYGIKWNEPVAELKI